MISGVVPFEEGGEVALWRPHKAVGLARALVKAGYGTRRQAEEMVCMGRVCVGVETITDPTHTVDAGGDVYLDAQHLQCLPKQYLALHKPSRVLCCARDRNGYGQRLLDSFFPSGVVGLVAAGRMDAKMSGLILISNDTGWNTAVTLGDGLEQEYRVRLGGVLTEIEIRVMTAGVTLPKLGLFRPRQVRIIESTPGSTVVDISVCTGKIRQVRRMLTTLRHQVQQVQRVRIGEIRLGHLAAGACRELTASEVASIQKASAVSR